MTTDKKDTACGLLLRNWGFGIPSSFVIRHSDFVILPKPKVARDIN